MTHGPSEPMATRPIRGWRSSDGSTITSRGRQPGDGRELRTDPRGGAADVPYGQRHPEEFSTTTSTRHLSVRPRWLCRPPARFEAWREKFFGRLRTLSFRRSRTHSSRGQSSPPQLLQFVEWERESGVQVRTTESGLLVNVTLHGLVSNEPPRDKQVTLVVLNEGESVEKLPDWAAQFVSNQSRMRSSRRAASGRPPGLRSRRTTLTGRILLVGRTVDQGRVWDIAAVARH